VHSDVRIAAPELAGTPALRVHAAGDAIYITPTLGLGLSVFCVSPLVSPAEAMSSAPVRSRMSFARFVQSELSECTDNSMPPFLFIGCRGRPYAKRRHSTAAIAAFGMENIHQETADLSAINTGQEILCNVNAHLGAIRAACLRGSKAHSEWLADRTISDGIQNQGSIRQATPPGLPRSIEFCNTTRP